MDVREIVEKLVSLHECRDPFRIAASMGMIVIQTPLIGVRGFYQYYKRNHIIYVDDSLEGIEGDFVCAHELGHALMHKTNNAVYMDSRTFLNKAKYEHEADMFAAHLLLDDEYFSDNPAATVFDVAQAFGVSEQVIRARIARCKASKLL